MKEVYYEVTVPTIADRVVQTCMKLVIEPIFEADFKDFSYGFRPKRSAHMAHREIYKYLNYGCRYVIDADVSNYFDTITHDILLKAINKRIRPSSHKPSKFPTKCLLSGL